MVRTRCLESVGFTIVIVDRDNCPTLYHIESPQMTNDLPMWLCTHSYVYMVIMLLNTARHTKVLKVMKKF